MKKQLLTLCVSALGALTNLNAQVTTPTEATTYDNLTTGWYQIQYVGPGWTTAAYNQFLSVLNYNSGVPHNGDNYDLCTVATCGATQSSLSTLIYVEDAGTTGTTKDNIATKNYTISLPNGNGIGKGGSRTNYASNKVGIFKDATNDNQVGLYNTISSNYGDVFAKNNTYHLFGAGAGQKDVRFKFYKIDVESSYDIYTVQYDASLTGTPVVTYNKSGYTGVTEMVAGGKIFVATGTTPADADFASTDANGVPTAVQVDASTKTLKVIKSVSQADYDAAIVNAKALLAKNGVGYPAAAARTTFNAAIATAEAASPSVAALETLVAAQNAYYNCTDIQMPEEGKVYTMTFVSPDGTKKHYIDCPNGASITLNDVTGKIPASARFIAHKEGDKYVFVNANGEYFVAKTHQAANTGHSAYYTAATCAATVSQMLPIASTGAGLRTPETSFGLVCIKFDGRLSSASQATYLIEAYATKAWNAISAPFFNETYTSGILMEEVAGADVHTSVTFNKDSKSDYYYASYYNFFPTAVPSGATAYTATRSTNSLKLTELEGGIIPKNTAVIMKSTAGGAQTMQVGLQTAAITIEANDLQGTVEAYEFVPYNTYVLNGTATEGVGFFKYGGGELPQCKAYLVAGDGFGARGYFTFDEEDVATGISQAEATAADEPVYDLSGRIAKNVKAGIYIKGGKTFIVK